MAVSHFHHARRLPRWFISLLSIGAVAGVTMLTPLEGAVLQAVLLGPDSLLPASAAQAVPVVRDGRRVMVPVRHGQVFERLTFAAPALHGRPESYDLYLPPGYDNPANAARRYPVLYLLHGAPGQPGDWIHGMHVAVMEDDGVAAGTLPAMIMVMPEGNGGVWHDSQYVNTRSGFPAETLVAHDMVRFVDSHYRTIADRRARAIAGISEGGYGAMNLGLKHVNTFGTIVSISGYFAANPAEVFAGNDPWGHDWQLMAANSPTRYVSRLAGLRDTHILIMDNRSDGPYTRSAIGFDRLLTRWHIPHMLVLQQANLLTAHYWGYWKAAFPTALTYIGRHLMTAAH